MITRGSEWSEAVTMGPSRFRVHKVTRYTCSRVKPFLDTFCSVGFHRGRPVRVRSGFRPGFGRVRSRFRLCPVQLLSGSCSDLAGVLLGPRAVRVAAMPDPVEYVSWGLRRLRATAARRSFLGVTRRHAGRRRDVTLVDRCDDRDGSPA